MNEQRGNLQQDAILPIPGPLRALAAFGAVACGIAVAIGAYAMHAGLTPHDQLWMGLAGLFLFGHGLALAALAPVVRSRLARIGLHVLATGLLLFVGSLLLATLCGFKPLLAPIGGSLLILGWLIVAAGMLT